MDTADFGFQVNPSARQNKTILNSELSNVISCNNNVTSFENVSFFLATRQYPNGLNLNQKRTLRKAATNFSLIGKFTRYTAKISLNYEVPQHNCFRQQTTLHRQKQNRKKTCDIG